MEIDAATRRRQRILATVLAIVVISMFLGARYDIAHGYDIISTSEPIEVTLERVQYGGSASGIFSGFTLAFRDGSGTVHEESYSNYGGIDRASPLFRVLFGLPEHCLEKYIGQQGKRFTLYSQKGTHVAPIFGNSSFDQDFKRGDVLEVACQGYIYR